MKIIQIEDKTNCPGLIIKACRSSNKCGTGDRVFQSPSCIENHSIRFPGSNTIEETLSLTVLDLRRPLVVKPVQASEEVEVSTRRGVEISRRVLDPSLLNLALTGKLPEGHTCIDYSCEDWGREDAFGPNGCRRERGSVQCKGLCRFRHEACDPSGDRALELGRERRVESLKNGDVTHVVGPTIKWWEW